MAANTNHTNHANHTNSGGGIKSIKSTIVPAERQAEMWADYAANGQAALVARTPAQLIENLLIFGVCIYKRVANPEECANMRNLAWDVVEHVTAKRVTRDDPATWKSWSQDYGLSHSFLVQSYGIGQSELCWFARMLAPFREAFRAIWGTDDLGVSFDGASIGTAPEANGPESRSGYASESAKKVDQWMHADQRIEDSELRCIQAWVTAEPVGKGDATLMVRPGSHAMHGILREYETHGLPGTGRMAGKTVYPIKKRKDWVAAYKIPEIGERMAASGVPDPIRIECDEGDAVFWDSRTLHCGIQPTKGRETPRNRVVSYVCMRPKAEIKKEMSKKRKYTRNMYVEKGMSTNHWGTSHFPTEPDIHPSKKAKVPAGIPIVPAEMTADRWNLV